MHTKTPCIFDVNAITLHYFQIKFVSGHWSNLYYVESIPKLIIFKSNYEITVDLERRLQDLRTCIHIRTFIILHRFMYVLLHT